MNYQVLNRFLVMVLFVVSFASCSSSDDNSENAMKSTKTDTVTISNMAFHPAVLTLNIGDTVIWMNEDIVAHDVAAFPNNEWSSDTLSMGQTWKKVINDDIDYFCNIHPAMKGKVLVIQIDKH